jgi:hypothetical protein
LPQTKRTFFIGDIDAGTDEKKSAVFPRFLRRDCVSMTWRAVSFVPPPPGCRVPVRTFPASREYFQSPIRLWVESA